MHLIYLDESGQTGTNLRDTIQPVFVLGALVVPEAAWLALEKDLQAAIEKSFPTPRPADFEIHATEISNPRSGYFKQFPIAHRLAFRDEWFLIAQKHALKFVYRAISKKNDFKHGLSAPLAQALPSIRMSLRSPWSRGSWMICSSRFPARRWVFLFRMKTVKLCGTWKKPSAFSAAQKAS